MILQEEEGMDGERRDGRRKRWMDGWMEDRFLQKFPLPFSLISIHSFEFETLRKFVDVGGDKGIKRGPFLTFTVPR